MELAIALGLFGWAALIVGALVFGGIAQMVGETRTGFEWLVDAIAAGFGALIASEFIVSWRTFEPVADGLALVPALIGGLVLGLALPGDGARIIRRAEVATRYLTGGTYAGRPMSA